MSYLLTLAWTAVYYLGFPDLSECVAMSSVQQTSVVCRVGLHSIDYDASNIFLSNSVEDAPSNYFLTCSPVYENNSVSNQLEALGGLSAKITEFHDRLRQNEEIFISVPEASVISESIYVGNSSSIQIIENPLNNSAVVESPTGNKTLLIVRVSSNDATPNASAEELIEYIFDGNLSLSQQMGRCSFGNLSLLPTKYGVMEVTLDLEALGQDSLTLVNAAYVKGQQQVLEDVESIDDVADIIFFVLPAGTRGNWRAWSSFKGKRSVFNDQWGIKISVLSHALGHMFGLDHANMNMTSDDTGYMGLSSSRVDFPARCFNAYNYWAVGWVRNKTLDFVDSSPGLFKLASFVDYNKAASEEFVALKIGNLFMHYNKKKDFNVNAGSFGNKVVIVNALEWGTNLVGALDLEQPTFRRQYNATDVILIKVCQVIEGDKERADIVILSFGFGKSYCDASLSQAPHRSCTPAPSTLRFISISPSSQNRNQADVQPTRTGESDVKGISSTSNSTDSSEKPQSVWIAAGFFAALLLLLFASFLVQISRGKPWARYRRIGSMFSVDGSSAKLDCADSSFTSASTRVFSNVSLERPLGQRTTGLCPPENLHFVTEVPVQRRDFVPCEEPPLKRPRREWLYGEGLWGASEI